MLKVEKESAASKGRCAPHGKALPPTVNWTVKSALVRGYFRRNFFSNAGLHPRRQGASRVS